MSVTPDLILSLCGLSAFASLLWLANRKAGEPPVPLRRFPVPWRLLIVISAFACFLILIHLANLAGLETGPGKGLLPAR